MDSNIDRSHGTQGRLVVIRGGDGGLSVVSDEAGDTVAIMPYPADDADARRIEADALRISSIQVMERELVRQDERLADLEGRLGAVTAERDALRQAISVMAAQTDALRWVLPVVAAHLPGGGGSDG